MRTEEQKARRKAKSIEYVQKYRQTHRKELIARQQDYYQSLRIEVLTYYGGSKLACVKCGFSNPNALCIDHINNDGANHRRLLGISTGYETILWLFREGFPEGFQTLCCNCNTIKKRLADNKIKSLPGIGGL